MAIKLNKIRKSMSEFYNTSDKYLKHLNEKPKDSLKRYMQLTEYFIKKYYKNKKVNVLDIGCGSGLSSYLLSRPGWTVTGGDISPKFIGYAKRYYRKQNLKFKVADAVKLPFENNSFNVVCSFEFIEHVTWVDKVLLEMNRVLKENGLIVIVSPNLCSPLLPIEYLFSRFMGKGTAIYWANTYGQTLRWFLKNIHITFKKIFSSKIEFLYREPDLEGKYCGGDADSVYLSNPLDIQRFLEKKGYKIIDITDSPIPLKAKVMRLFFRNLVSCMRIVAVKS